MAMQVAAGLMTSAAGAVVALTALVQGIEKLAAEMPALNKVLVQVGLKKVPVGQLTDHDKQMLVASLELA
jgi:poly(3-hydroxyalkanoate) synthetase